MSDHKHKLNLEQAKKFLFGGNATFTVVSTKTKARYTFKVKVCKTRGEINENLHFVSYLNGSDNYTNYSFVGTLFNKEEYKWSKKSKTTYKSTVNQTFMWLFKVLMTNDQKKFDMIEFWHEGKCAACNKKLTDPLSIELGFGPICRKK